MISTQHWRGRVDDFPSRTAHYLRIFSFFLLIVSRVPGQIVAGQFVAGQFVADHSSRTIRRKIKYWFYRKYCFHFSNIPFYSSIPLPLRQHSFNHSSLHFRYTFFIASAPTSAIFVSPLPIPIPQHSIHQSRFHFIKMLFINPASISATLSCIQIYNCIRIFY